MLNPNIDKSSWGEGPWLSEPDEMFWQDPTTNYFCAIIRHPTMGSLNGYVNIPTSHPANRLDYDDINVDVHGGLTYSGVMDFQHLSKEFPRLPERAYWVGFDCAHAFDLVPAMQAFHAILPRDEYFTTLHDTYRTIDYVRAECEKLAAQLKAQEK